MLKNKKVLLSLVGILVLSLFVLNFVSAYRYGFIGSFDHAIYQAQPILQFFFGDGMYTTSFMFEKILLFLLILSLVFVSLKNIPLFRTSGGFVDNKNILTLVSIIVSLLSVRYIDTAWLYTVLTTYKAFGIIIVSVLPFIIYFFFLIGIAPPEQMKYSSVRKIGWALFACVYLMLYSSSSVGEYGDVYLWTALVSFLVLFLDGTIARYMINQKMRAAGSANIIEHLAKLNKRLDEIENAPRLTRGQKDAAKRPIIESINQYTRELRHF